VVEGPDKLNRLIDLDPLVSNELMSRPSQHL
jgi:hypothetical protein